MAAETRVDSATSTGFDDEHGAPPTPEEAGATRAPPAAELDAPSTRNRAARPRASGRRPREVPADVEIARLAAKNHRIVSWRQLEATGLSDRAVAHRVATGRLYRVHHGVYLLEPPEGATRMTLFAAAVTACEPDAVLSHYSAAELWGLHIPMAGEIDVTVVGRNPGNRRTGIRIHRAAVLHPNDIRVRDGLRVTAPARVALELARDLDASGLEQLLARARVEQSIRDADFVAVLHRYPAYPGAGILRAAMERADGPALTRSQAERRLLDLIRRAGLPQPVTNMRTGRYEVDFLWRDAQLVVEVDGYAFHRDRAAFERDRRRDAALMAAGMRVMRFTWRQIVEEPLTVVARIAQVLGGALG